MKIGFIGCGNMGSAMIGGILKNGVFEKNEIIVSNLPELHVHWRIHQSYPHLPVPEYSA